MPIAHKNVNTAIIYNMNDNLRSAIKKELYYNSEY